MAYSFPKLTIAFALLLAHLSASQAIAQRETESAAQAAAVDVGEADASGVAANGTLPGDRIPNKHVPGNPVPSNRAASAGQDNAEGESDARQSLMQAAATRLAETPSVVARVRHRMDLFGHQLVGSGNYLQQGRGAEILFRLELKIQTSDRSTSLEQVCDGRFLWIRRDWSDQATLGRIDLQRVRTAHTGAGRIDLYDALALGGLPNVLRQLNLAFQFEPPLAGRLGDVEIWVVRGNWRAERLAQLLPARKDALLAGDSNLADLPPQIPRSVTVLLGKQNLFPYRIEYFHGSEEEEASAGRLANRPLLTVEFFEVGFGTSIDPLRFSYQPGDLKLSDETDQFLQRLGL